MKSDQDGHYSKLNSGTSYAPIEIKGKRGTVVSVGEKATYTKKSMVGQLDAFGKPITESSIVNPYLEVVVKVDDGAEAAASTYSLASSMSIQKTT